MSLLRVIPMSLLAVGAIACADADDVLTDADIAAIEQTRQAFAQGIVAGDYDGVMALRTEDVVWMPPNMPLLVGKERIREFLDAGPTTLTFTLTPGRSEGRDGLAYERGRFEQSYVMGTDTLSEAGKYLVVLRRQEDGRWLLAVEMWSSDSPPPAPAPAPAPARRR